MYRRLLLLLLTAGWLTGLETSAADNPEANGWVRTALQNLYVGEDLSKARRSRPEDFVREDRDLPFRCVRKNNYWCLKNFSKWRGVVGTDSDLHGIFERPDLAARAFVRTLRRYYRACGLKTAEAILCKYAPDNDCIGSDAERLPDGTCRRGLNRCQDYARFISRRLGVKADQDLRLFDAEGVANLQRVIPFAQYVGRYETKSFIPSKVLIEQGLKLERDPTIRDGSDTTRCPF